MLTPQNTAIVAAPAAAAVRPWARSGASAA